MLISELLWGYTNHVQENVETANNTTQNRPDSGEGLMTKLVAVSHKNRAKMEKKTVYVDRISKGKALVAISTSLY